jgi:NAD+ synthase (glutamine-hydrolysing)
VVVPFKGKRIGLTICEDIWLGDEPLKPLKKLKPEIVLNISASPFHAGKMPLRHAAAARAARFLKAPVLYANTVGGQDELVFDGGSFVMSPTGKVVRQFPQFETGLYSAELPFSFAPAPKLSRIEEIYCALVLGIRDYVEKNKFEKVALGVSGGIDSALVAALAVQALGPERVVAVTMPSRYNSDATHSDAVKLAKNLGVELLDIAIQPLYEMFLSTLEPAFRGTEPNIAEENIQARIRGTLLMSLSNKFGWLILTTGNKSEISTGYCTLYGDTAGGFAVLKDVLKTTVYELSRHINTVSEREVIPVSTIDRRPTAELRANQFDEDSLGSYAALDPIIVGYVEQNKSLGELTASLKQDPAYIKKIVTLIDRNEYKRRQAPPGIKITPRSFGRDHRMPITNRYRPA